MPGSSVSRSRQIVLISFAWRSRNIFEAGILREMSEGFGEMTGFEKRRSERSLCDSDYNWREPDHPGAGHPVQVDDEIDPVFSGLYDARGEPLYAVRSQIGLLKFK
jgi:hypothetical protein